MTSVLLYEYVILQLGLSIVITLVAVCYILEFKPFEEPIINRLEVMTEFFTILLLCVTYTFTDLFDDTEFQYNIGFVFIVLMCLCIGGHLVCLGYDMVQDMILYVKQLRYGQ